VEEFDTLTVSKHVRAYYDARAAKFPNWNGFASNAVRILPTLAAT
jgi:hypothetical protein